MNVDLDSTGGLDVYEGEPDFDGLQLVTDGTHEDFEDDIEGFTEKIFGALSSSSQRDTKETLQWYKSHRTTSQIGFNPDAMCLKVVRIARNIGSMFPSALAAQHATPARHQIHKVRDIRTGMIGFYDDPRDSNPFGHVVGFTGRDSKKDPDKLESLLLDTNSVLKGKLVTVRGDYFQKHWGDEFQFAATWLNGQPLLMPAPPAPPDKPTRLDHAIADLVRARNWHSKVGKPRNKKIAAALQKNIDSMRATKAELKI